MLTRALSLDAGDPARVAAAVTALRAADEKLKAVAGTDADACAASSPSCWRPRWTSMPVTETAIARCVGSKAGLNADVGRASSRTEIDRLRIIASGSDQAHRAAETARRKAQRLLTAPPKLLAQLFEIGLDGLATAARTVGRVARRRIHQRSGRHSPTTWKPITKRLRRRDRRAEEVRRGGAEAT